MKTTNLDIHLSISRKKSQRNLSTQILNRYYVVQKVQKTSYRPSWVLFGEGEPVSLLRAFFPEKKKQSTAISPSSTTPTPQTFSTSTPFTPRPISPKAPPPGVISPSTSAISIRTPSTNSPLPPPPVGSPSPPVLDSFPPISVPPTQSLDPSQDSLATRATNTLWQSALNGLRDEDRERLDPNQDIKQVLKELLEVTQQKKTDSENKQWSYNTRNGDKRLVRDSVNTCLTNLTKFVPVVDATIGALPAIASAPWGVVKFLLTTVTTGVENTRIIFESIENLSRILVCCTIYENLYIYNSTLESSTLLQSSLVSLYVSVLKYLCYAGKHFSRNTAGQYGQGIGEAIWKGLDEHLESISSGEIEVKQAVDLASKQDQSKKLNEIAASLSKVIELREPISRIESTLDAVFTTIESQKRSAILGWLSDISYKSHHHLTRSSRHPHTGNWLLMKDRFSNWKERNSTSLLWLHGIAGSGKTMLASQIIDLMEPEYNEYALAYFYCNYKESGRRDPESILRSLIKQLCLQSPTGCFPASLLAIYNQRQKEDDLRPLAVDEIKCLLLNLTAGFLQSTIIIDALDECDKGTREIIFDTFEALMSTAKNAIKIFVTSRDDGDLMLRLENSPNVYIQPGENDGDISLFIDSEIEACIQKSRLLKGDVSNDLKDAIVATLTKKAQGMFIWVRFQLDRICKETTAVGVLESLEELPVGLNEMYSVILAKITHKGESQRTAAIAMKALRWIFSAVRPLSPTELIEAISVTPMSSKIDTDGLTQSKILDICQNLVVFDENLNVLRFAHFSIQEFLLLELDSAQCHTNIAEICLTLLAHHDKNEELALLDYSTFNWPLHVRSGGSGSQQLRCLWIEFLKPYPAYDSWVEKCSQKHNDLLPMHSRSLPPLLMACFFHLQNIFKYLLDSGADHDDKNQHGRNSLHIAAMCGNVDAVKLLLQIGVNIESEDQSISEAGSQTGYTPLLLAVEGGHEAVVKTLLELGANYEYPNTAYTQPLVQAARGGHAGMMHMLLEKGADVHLTESDGQSALYVAVRQGHEKVVQIILEEGVDVNSTNCYGQPALYVAAWGGHEKVVQMLFEKGADVNVTDSDGQSALYVAVRQGHEKVVQILLGKGPDVNVTSYDRQSALYVAAERGYEKVVQMLLEKGADVNMTDSSGQSALYVAARWGHEKMVQMLLEKGADVNVTNSSGQSALYVAARQGYEKVVQMLLEKGADVNVTDSDGWSALYVAARQGYEKVVQMLLEKGADVNVTCSYGRSALHVSARWRHEKVVQALLEHGADIEIADTSGKTALTVAREFEWQNIVQLLLRKGADTELAEVLQVPR